MRNRIIAIVLVGLLLAVFLLKSCAPDESGTGPEPGTTPTEQPLAVPSFNTDSSYNFIAKQVAFGPRVPASEGHKKCGDWLVATLAAFGADTVIEQKGTVTAYNGQPYPLRNIIASWRPEKKERILLLAHWDTRPFADRDKSRKNEAIDGANDGGSGVGILLEIARHLKDLPSGLGVDIFFTDVEDMGEPAEGGMGAALDNAESMKSWCLGSQYWVRNPHVKDYTARFGILLDMCGTTDARFPREALSMKYAPNIVNKVWQHAAAAGHGDRFLSETRVYVGIDDHIPVNQELGIPTIDIIAWDPNTMGFTPSWHTHADNMSVIDKATLNAVGSTVMRTLWAEK